ncbi:MAG: PEP-CTERM sorting domain-containing protein [Planctomycetota bacterium]|nr:PEP-CTERM sorting domain-containing protein [Planctomycetota bacterium]
MKRCVVCSIAFLISSAISYADIYQIPLDVNGYYEFGDSILFNIDLGTQLTEVHDVRFNCSGDIAAIDALGLFECTFFAGVAKCQHAYTDVISSPFFTPFTCDNIPFISSNSATWDFLLDGEASGYIRLITNIVYIPEFPPEHIYGNIYSASLSINATPVPEPCTLLLLGLGGLALLRRHRA